jgi:hypothetical protein
VGGYQVNTNYDGGTLCCISANLLKLSQNDVIDLTGMAEYCSSNMVGNHGTYSLAGVPCLGMTFWGHHWNLWFGGKNTLSQYFNEKCAYTNSIGLGLLNKLMANVDRYQDQTGQISLWADTGLMFTIPECW